MNPSPCNGGPADIATGPNGARAHARLIAQTEILQKRLYNVSEFSPAYFWI